MELASSYLTDHATTSNASPALHALPLSRQRLWTGRVLSGLPALFLLMDATMKLLLVAPAVEGSAKLGYGADSVFTIGVLELIATLLYLLPRTAFFGALLLTGYLGGAIATHVRVADPLFSHTLFPVYVALMLWAGITLRDRRLEALVRDLIRPARP